MSDKVTILVICQHNSGRSQIVEAYLNKFYGDHVIVVKIDDTGSGIPQEKFSKLFDPFFTTKPTGMGTGLGLSLAYGIIKEHDGNIFASSWPGGGAALRPRWRRTCSDRFAACG